jgi:hypothetical protein
MKTHMWVFFLAVIITFRHSVCTKKHAEHKHHLISKLPISLLILAWNNPKSLEVSSRRSTSLDLNVFAAHSHISQGTQNI